METKYSMPLPATLITALIAGCGGGTTSSSRGGAVYGINTASLNSTVTRSSADEAAKAKPRPGSVTQSSQVGDSGIDDGVTLDKVNVSVEYSGASPVVGLINSGTNAVWASADQTSAIAMAIDGNVESQTTKLSDLNYANLYVVEPNETDSKAVMVVGALTYRVAADSDDYLSNGLWAYIPSSSVDEVQVGVFADASDDLYAAANASVFTPQTEVTASCLGDVLGHYYGKSPDSDGDNNLEEFWGLFIGQANLSARFNVSPTICGTISNLEPDAIVGISSTLISSYMSTLSLNEAAIDPTQAGGFFTGTLTTHGQSTVMTNYTGNWGGQFYDVNVLADLVGGTFGTRTADDYSPVANAPIQEIILLGGFTTSHCGTASSDTACSGN